MDVADPGAEGPDDPPATRVRPEPDRQPGGQDDPERRRRARPQHSRGDQRQGDHPHRLLGVVGAVGHGEHRRRDPLPELETPGDATGFGAGDDPEGQVGHGHGDERSEHGGQHGGQDDLVHDDIEIDGPCPARHPGRADQAPEERVRRAGGQPEVPGHQVPHDGADEPREDHDGVDEGLVDQSAGDGLSDLDRQERPGHVQAGGDRDGGPGPEGARRDGCGHGVGRVVETVGEVEGQGGQYDDDHHDQRDVHGLPPSMTAGAITRSTPRTGRRCLRAVFRPRDGRVAAIGSAAPHPPRRNPCPSVGATEEVLTPRSAVTGRSRSPRRRSGWWRGCRTGSTKAGRPDRVMSRPPAGGTIGASRASEVDVVSSHARAWWARASLALVVLAVAVLVAFSDRRGLWLMALTAGAVVVAVAGVYWFLQQRGVLRWVALALAVGAPLAVLGVFVTQRLLWVALLALAIWVAATFAARAALRPEGSAWALPVRDAAAARHPFVIMNPRSGGGKVTRFDLQQRAEALGGEVALLDHPGTDVQQLARDALAQGADLLGVAGGDGTQARVAEVAAEHDVPFLVISAGTRNHFALDLGLDRENPAL